MHSFLARSSLSVASKNAVLKTAFAKPSSKVDIMEIEKKYFLLTLLLVITPALCMTVPKLFPKKWQSSLLSKALPITFTAMLLEMTIFLLI